MSLHIGEVLNGVYDEDLGWRPASGATKPVHVANGLAVALRERVGDVAALHEVVVWWKRGGVVDDSRSYEELLSTPLGDRVRALAADAAEFDRVRRYLVGLLNADGGVFPSVPNSDFTLTCGQMASRSGNDRGLGEFGAVLLGGEDAGGTLREVVQGAFSTDIPRDPLTAAAWPLLSEDERQVTVRTRALTALNRRHNAAVVAELRAAASTLATHERTQGNRLRTLERATHFVCTATHVHAHAYGAAGELGDRIPVLIAAGGERISEVSAASGQTLSAMYAAFETELGERLAARLRRGGSLVPGEKPLAKVSTDGREMRPVLKGVLSARAGHPEPGPEMLDARMADFEEAREFYGREDAPRAVAHGLVASYLREYTSGGPRPFLRGLNSRAGLIYPHFQGGGQRRIRPSNAILDLLVRCCVESGTAMPADAFLERLWNRFGMVIGGRRNVEWDDAEVLENAGVRISASALDTNARAFEDQLAHMGLARRYADHVTFVGDVHVI